MIQRLKKKLQYIFTTSHRPARCADFISSKLSGNAKVSVMSITKGRSSVFQREQIMGDNPESVCRIPLTDTYLAMCNNSKVIGGSSVVVSSNGIILYDMLCHYKDYNANITDHGLFMLAGKPIRLFGYYFYNYSSKSKKIIKAGIALACNMSGNYYHFIYDCIARFSLLRSQLVPKDIPLLVDERVLLTPSMKEVLDAMNTDGRDYISLKENMLYEVKSLYVLSPVNRIVPNIDDMKQIERAGHVFDRDSLNYMRKLLLPLRLEGVRTPKKIFISRGKCRLRRMNEDEVFPLFQKYGFQKVFIEGMSLAQQITLFSNAVHIVAASGAALSNLLFCNPGTKVLIFIGEQRPGVYSSLALTLGIYSQGLIIKSDEARIHAHFFKADPIQVEKYLTIEYGE